MMFGITYFIFGFTVGLISCWPDFYLYTPKNRDQSFHLTVDNFNSSPFSKSLNTTIVIHGFGASTADSWMQDIKNFTLSQGDLNVILVDWKKGAEMPNYIAAKDNVFIMAAKLNSLIKSTSIDPQSIYCIGHSLGAHGCGLSSAGMKYSRITGMDPAGPLFHKADSNHRLDIKNANYVDIINTDSCFGIHRSLGHKNYYPNGGASQPGCIKDPKLCEYLDSLDHRNLALPIYKSFFIACDHDRSYLYFVDSFKKGCNFKSTLCDSYDHFKAGKCKCTSNKDCVDMGFHSIDFNVTGDFYLYTNSNEPFCQN